MTRPDTVVQVRIPRVNLAAVLLAAVCTVPLAFASPWLLVVWLLPVVALLHVLRAGVDADVDGLTARTAWSTRRLGWDEIRGLRINRARVAAVLRDGSAVRLPVVRPRHLPVLSAASGGRLPDPTADAQ